MNDQVIVRFLQIASEHFCDPITLALILNWQDRCSTIFEIGRKVDRVSNADIYHSQKPLILLLELFLIEHLYCEYTVFSCTPEEKYVKYLYQLKWRGVVSYISNVSFQYGFKVLLMT